MYAMVMANLAMQNQVFIGLILCGVALMGCLALGAKIMSEWELLLLALAGIEVPAYDGSIECEEASSEVLLSLAFQFDDIVSDIRVNCGVLESEVVVEIHCPEVSINQPITDWSYHRDYNLVVQDLKRQKAQILASRIGGSYLDLSTNELAQL